MAEVAGKAIPPEGMSHNNEAVKPQGDAHAQRGLFDFAAFFTLSLSERHKPPQATETPRPFKHSARRCLVSKTLCCSAPPNLSNL